MNPIIKKLRMIYNDGRRFANTQELVVIDRRLNELEDQAEYILEKILSLGVYEFKSNLIELEEAYDKIERELHATLLVGIEQVSLHV